MLEIQDFTPKCDLCSIRRLVEYIHVARCFRFINSWKDLERKSVFCLCYVMLLIQIWQIINLIRARAGKDTLVYCCRAKLCSHFLGRTEGYLLLPPKCKTFKDEIFIFEESRFSAICSALNKRFVFVLCHCRFQFP